MTYNKSEIMRNAWKYNRNSLTRKRLNITTFADALRAAWTEAKDEVISQITIATLNKTSTGYVKAEHLNVGDIIEVEDGRGFKAQKAIVAIENGTGHVSGWLTFKFTGGDLACRLPYNTVNRIAVAA